MKIFTIFALVLLFVFNVIIPVVAAEAPQEKVLIDQVTQAKKGHGENSLEHLDALSKLGKFYEKDPQYRPQLKKLLAEFIDRFGKVYGSNSKEIEKTKLGLSDLYLNDDEPQKAIPILESLRDEYIRDALTANPSKADGDIIYSPNLSMVELSLVYAYINTKQIEKAENELNEFFQHIKNRDDTDSPKKNNHLTALSYGSWAGIKIRQNNLKQALEYQAKSVSIYEQDPSLPRYEFAAAQSKYDRLKAFSQENSSNTFNNVEDERIQKGDLDESIKLLEARVKKLKSDPQHNSFQLGSSYLQLSIAYSQKYEALKTSGKAPSNVKEIFAKAKWLDSAIDSAKHGVEAFKNASHAETHLSFALCWLAFMQINFDVGDVDEVVAILHASIEAANHGGVEDIVVSASETLLCFLYAAKEKPELSILWGKKAANTLQVANQPVKSFSLSEKGLLSTMTRTMYEVVPTLMIYQGRVAEAQQVLQMQKERELYETFRDAAEDPRKMRLQYTDAEQAALNAYNEVLKNKPNQANDKSAKTYAELSAAMKSRLSQIDSAVKMTTSKALQNNATVLAETTSLKKAINGLAVSEPHAKAVGLQYLITKEGLIIVLNVPNAEPLIKTVPVTSIKLYVDLAKASQQLQNPKADAKFYTLALKDLYQVLIKPIQPELQKYKAKTLMLSLDSKLRLIPFAALIGSDNRYLIEKYTVALYNEAANQALDKPSEQQWRVAAMGLSKPVHGLPALIAVPDELKGVLASEGILGDGFLDEQFTRNQFVSVIQPTAKNTYNVLHVASHFELKPANPADSTLFMGDGSSLSLKELSSLPLNFKNFDLVTYSACQTAVTGNSQPDDNGSQIESLSAQTQRQGAQAVMATLWKVSDKSTASLMQGYYTKRSQGLNKAEALKSVQLEMALGKVGNPEWKSPHHWAGFVISGNWR